MGVITYSWMIGTLYLMAVVGFAIFIIMKRRPVGVTLAWLVLLFALPVAGFALYLLFGSPRLGRRRMQRFQSLYPDYSQWYQHLSTVLAKHSNQMPAEAQNSIYALAKQSIPIPLLPSNHIRLYASFESIFAQMMADINSAKQSLVLEFYIWEPTGRMEEMANAVIRAAQRGVNCTIVLDNVGSYTMLSSEWIGQLKQVGIVVTSSMPVSAIGMAFERMDIRNHRKILVVDEYIGWTGSFNLVDPAIFKQDAQVGQWIDAMVRIEGVASHVLSAIVQWDKALERSKYHPSFSHPYSDEQHAPLYNRKGGAHIHILPSGPDHERDVLHQMLLTATYDSKEELLLSTPYFVPDDSLLTALKSAALRGVKVQLLVPSRNDSRMVHYASRSYYQELLDAGVNIQQFDGGLLHTKCVLVDQKTVLFGTVNLDMRSVWLNYEVTLIIYDATFGTQIAALLQNYISQATPVDGTLWSTRPFRVKFLENAMQLLSPLL